MSNKEIKKLQSEGAQKPKTPYGIAKILSKIEEKTGIDLYKGIHDLDELMDKYGIEHPKEGKEYEKLSVSETVQDVLQSVGTEAAKLMHLKTDEKDYDSKTLVGDVSKYSYKNGAPLVFGKMLYNTLKFLSKFVKFDKKNTSEINPKKYDSIQDGSQIQTESNGQPENTNPNQTDQQIPFGGLTRKRKSDEPIESAEPAPPKEEYLESPKQPYKSKYQDATDAIEKKPKIEKEIEGTQEQLNKESPKPNKEWKTFNFEPVDTPIYPQRSQEELAFLYKYHSAFGEHFDEEKLMMSDETVNSPVYQEMKRLSQYNFSPLAPNAYVATTRINLDNFYDGQISARDVMQDEVAKARINDKSLKEAINDLFASEEYKSAPDYHPDYMQDSKVSMLDFLITRYNYCAKAHLMRSQNNFRNAQGLTLNQEDMRIFNIETQKHLKQRISRGKEILRIMNG